MGYICIDIGGTKTLVCNVSKDGKIERQIRFATPHEYSEFIALLAQNVAEIATDNATLTVVGAPSKIDFDTGVIVACGNLPWRNVPLQKDVTAMTHTPVLLRNDAKLAGLAEAQPLKDRYRKILYITVSTGINIGLVVDGKLDDTFAESEAGQIIVEYQGKEMTWEKLASGSALVRTYGKQASEIDDPLIWKEVSHKLALGMTDLIAIIQPDVIVLGGGVGTHYNKYEKPLREALRAYRNPLVDTPPIVQAVNPELAVIYGCYELAKAYDAEATRAT